MKGNKITILLFILNIILFKKTESFSLENILGISNEENNSETDSDDVILKLKVFFDKYANSLKNNLKTVDKLILPAKQGENEKKLGETEGENKQNFVYVEKFDLKEFENNSKNSIEQLISVKERNLNNFREDKQKEEEKNIDYITKKKIYSSRLNIANTEMGKNQKDLNEKITEIISNTNEIDNKSNLSENLLKENFENMKKLKDVLIKINNVSENLNLDKNIFKKQEKVDGLKENLLENIYKSKKEGEFFSEHQLEKLSFIGDLNKLKKIFDENLIKIKNKNVNLKSSLKNKTEIIENLKAKISNRYDALENLNNTASKLKVMQQEYKNNLRQIDDEIILLKSKKKIIQENINDKKTQKLSRKKSIENVLSNLDKQMNNYNVDEISLNKYRKDITSVNNNLKNILSKENMIFKMNKIKI